MTVRTFGEWIDDDIATEKAPISRLGPRHFWNALKKSDERKWLAGLALS
jgi:hypothetical protein